MAVEQRLLDLEAQFAVVSEITIDAVFVFDERGQINRCNRASEQIFGYRVEEIEGTRIDRLIPELSIEKRAIDSASQRDLLARDNTGREFPVRVVVGHYSMAGQTRHVAIAHDISALKSAEAELRQREDLLRQTIQHAPTGIATVDLEGRFISVNHAFCSMLGYRAGELIGRSVNSVTHPDDVEMADQRLRQLRQDEINEYEMRKRYIRKDGSIVESFMNACLIRDAKGSPVMYVGQAEDLTERLDRERQLKDSQDRLAHVTRLHTLGEMATGIAHEINQPLTAISTYAHAGQRLLESDSLDREKLQGALGKISTQAGRAGDVIRRLRNLVRTHSSARTLVEIESLVREIVELAEVDAKSHDVTIQVDLQQALPRVLADPVQLQQVVLNLLRNAMEAMAAPHCAPRTILVSARSVEEDYVEIAVRDRGIGISSDVERQLFKTFYSTKKSGLGMGLPISRSILDAHGGHLGFTRNEDRGTTFRISLPAVSGDIDDEE